MINLNISIRNSYTEQFKNIKCWAGKTLIKHKFWEFQIMQTSDIVSACLDITHRQDHAGIRISLGLAGYNIDASIYDDRHWDYEKNQWAVYSDEKDCH